MKFLLKHPFHFTTEFSMLRRFEFIGGSSAKFWSVLVSGKAVTVKYGRLGTNGQSQAKSFSSNEKAQQHAEGLIRQKLAKGYVECVAAQSTP
jgi:predicted DNA-binding WGR domain protein